MKTWRWAALVMGMLMILAGLGRAAEPPPLGTATGLVSKATANVLFILPRGADGRFEKKLPLKLRGTSKATAVGTQKRAGQEVLVQRDVDIKDLQPNQGIAVIYASTPDGFILLSAVVQSPGSK
jgi:hypothetical protein